MRFLPTLAVGFCLLFALANWSVTTAQTVIAPSAAPVVYGDMGTGVAGLRSDVYLIVDFDDSFEDTGFFGACSPILRIAVGPTTVNASYVPRGEFNSDVANSPYLEDYQLAFKFTVTDGMQTPAGKGITVASPQVSAITNFTSCPAPAGSSFNGSLAGLDTITPMLQVSTRPPSVVQIATSTKVGSYKTGDVFSIVVSFSSKVIVDIDDPQNPPILLLSSGGSAIYKGTFVPGDATKGSADHVFRYAVGTGEKTATGSFLDAASNVSLLLRSGLIYDAASGVPATTTIPVGKDPGSLSSTVSITVLLSGQKFPPQLYDASARPGDADPADTAANSVSQQIAAMDAHTIDIMDDDARPPFTKAAFNKSFGEFVRAAMSPANQQQQVTVSSRSARLQTMAAAAVNPTVVSLLAYVNNILEVQEKAGLYRADITLVQSWYDSRFKSSSLNSRTFIATADLAKIWRPQITFENTRERPNVFDQSASAANTGIVTLVERYVIALSADINIRDFPFDSQVLKIELRSAVYDSADMLLVGPTSDAMTKYVRDIENGAFSFDDYRTSNRIASTGPYAGFSVLGVKITAKRTPTFNAITALLPLITIHLILILTFGIPLKSDQRLGVPVACFFSTIAVTVALGNTSPPVSYLTRMILFILITFVYCILTLCIQFAMRYHWEDENAPLQKYVPKPKPKAEAKVEAVEKLFVNQAAGSTAAGGGAPNAAPAPAPKPPAPETRFLGMYPVQWKDRKASMLQVSRMLLFGLPVLMFISTLIIFTAPMK